MPFLHGILTLAIEQGARAIRTPRTAVIGLVGTAPMHHVAPADRTLNAPVLVRSDRDAAALFGPDRAGYTIPSALNAIFAQGAGLVVVVNTFDPATDKTAVASAPYVVGADDRIVLPHEGLQAVVVKSQDNVTTYVAGTHYTLDAAAGVITRIASAPGGFAAGATLNVAYDRADPSLVTSADVVGTVDGSGNRTGLKALQDAAAALGFGPKILIAPGFSSATTVAAELAVQAAALRAVALVDAPAGNTVSQAIAGRAAGQAHAFASSSTRVVCCYPYVKATGPSGAERLEPLSQRLAGAIARADDERGYWWSPSMQELRGVTGLERRLSASLSDGTTDVQLLNAAGITTVYNDFGSGFRVFGNRSAAYPSSSSARGFVPVQRVEDVIRDALEVAMAAYLDRPIDDALVDAVIEEVNGFLRTLKARGALVDGSCRFDPTKNPASELAAGHLTFDVSFMPPVPAEKIEFQAVLDTSLLATVGQPA